MSRKEEAALIQEVSSSQLMQYNERIASFWRHSGCEEERAAFEYVASELERAGLKTDLSDHPALISYPVSASLTLLGAFEGSINCLGTAYSRSVEGFEAEVIDLQDGTPDDYSGRDVSGKIVLLNGLATPTAAFAAEAAGAVGQIFINDERLHYMIVSTIWGTPTPSSAHRIPSTPSVSVVESDGHRLREMIVAGPLRVRLDSDVFMDWQQTPLLTADLPGQESEDFVLFSGHLDSWEYGAMDNGSANATMLEVARLLASRSDALYRGVRFAFWSGHSHGRYAGSTWYADHHWEELQERCIAHVNVDSTGARGATFYQSFPANLELGPFGAEVVEAYTGQKASARRMSRAGDMSFNGIGIPALFMSLSQVPFSDEDTDYVSRAFGKLIGGKMPWWWHTSEDTMDKVDPDVLVLDTKIYVATIWRLATEPLLPMDFRPVIADITTSLDGYQEMATTHLDLGLLRERAEGLKQGVEALAEKNATHDAEIISLNERIKRLSRILIPITYTEAGRFEHDPAWGLPHLPALAGVHRLAELEPGSDEYHFLRTELNRARNRVGYALRQALEILDQSD